MWLPISVGPLMKFDIFTYQYLVILTTLNIILIIFLERHRCKTLSLNRIFTVPVVVTFLSFQVSM